MLAFVATGAGIGLALRHMRCHWIAAAFGALFFAGVLLIASDYVGMNDPQLWVMPFSRPRCCFCCARAG